MKNTMLSTMIENRAFANKILDKNNTTVAENLAVLNVKLTNLLNLSYSAFVAMHDSATASELSPVFTAFKDLLTLVNTENDCTVRCDENTARTIIAYAITVKNEKSAKLQDEEGKLRELRQALDTLEDTNGCQESAIENARTLVQNQEKVVNELKILAGSVQKVATKATMKDFAKRVEDYIADLAMCNFMKSNATLEAEAEAKKKARAEKQKAKRQAKKAQEKEQKANSKDASIQAQVNANA